MRCEVETWWSYLIIKETAENHIDKDLNWSFCLMLIVFSSAGNKRILTPAWLSRIPKPYSYKQDFLSLVPTGQLLGDKLRSKFTIWFVPCVILCFKMILFKRRCTLTFHINKVSGKPEFSYFNKLTTYILFTMFQISFVTFDWLFSPLLFFWTTIWS